ncbi:hypothetical protein HMPREF1430_00715, partial [Helicobacter pylori GAM96Ai]
ASETILKSILALKNGKSQAQTKGLATLKKTRETEFLISYYQNPKYPLVFCPLLVLWVF